MIKQCLVYGSTCDALCMYDMLCKLAVYSASRHLHRWDYSKRRSNRPLNAPSARVEPEGSAVPIGYRSVEHLEAVLVIPIVTLHGVSRSRVRKPVLRSLEAEHRTRPSQVPAGNPNRALAPTVS